MTHAGITHLVIPDTQVKPGVPTDHLRWVGKYIADKRPDVVIHLGDHWDMPSLSFYDRGKKAMEGRRYESDVEAGNAAFRLLNAPVNRMNAQLARRDKPEYNPRRVLLRGNHEDRITRAVENKAMLEGTLSLDDLESPGWEVHEFLQPVTIHGVTYAHYFYNAMTGRAYGGQVHTRLKTIGRSFTMGHQQTYDYACRPIVGGLTHHGLVAGACYLHTEDYLGPQGNDHWRGIVVKHEVHDGTYDIMPVSMQYLCRRYEGVDLETFMQETYGTVYPVPVGAVI